MQRAALVALAAWIVACEGPRDPVLVAGDDVPTWHRDVAPLVIPACTGCHAAGGVMAAVDLTDPETAAMWSPALAAMVAEADMPPFPAQATEDCAPPISFADDRRLASGDIDTIVAWDDAGAPLGDPTQAAPISLPDAPTLTRVDQVLAPADPVPVPSNDRLTDRTLCVMLDPALADTRWLEGVQVVPDALDVVHHVRLDLTTRERARQRDETDGVRDGSWTCSGQDYVSPVGGYAPGMGPQRFPSGSGIPLGPEDVLVAAIHYHLVAQPRLDRTQVHLQWAAHPPARRAWLLKTDTAVTAEQGLQPGPGDRDGVEFRIPAGVADHREVVHFPVPGHGAFEVFSVFGHMHSVGTALRVRVLRADGTPGPCLLSIPRWDFDWQLFYTYDTDLGSAPVIHGGDTVVLECIYDNTRHNPEVARILDNHGLTDPVDVGYGSGSEDEMCSMMVGVVPEQ